MTRIKDSVMALNHSKFFSRIASELRYDRVGLELLKDGKVFASFTSYNRSGSIYKVKEGLDDVAFVTRMSLDVFKKMTEPAELQWMEEHPILAVKKYLTKVSMPMKIRFKIARVFLG